MVSAFHGREGGLGERLDPFEDAWFTMTGSEAMGPDWSVALAGGTLALGAPWNGSVLIFHLDGREAGAIGGQSVVLPDIADDDAGSRLGASLLLQDQDGDGQRDLLVAAPAARGTADAVSAGRVYLFDTSGRFARLPPDSAEDASLGPAHARATLLGASAYDQAGSVIAGCGDLDGDGLGELLVAARWDEEGGAALAGGVSLVSSRALAERAEATAEATPIADLAASYHAGETGAAAGAAARCDLDLNGDGLVDLAVGAPFADGPGGLDAAGAVYLLDGDRLRRDLDARSSNALEEAASLTILGPEPESYLGSALAVGDVAGDGRLDLLVGAPGGGGREQGLALLYPDLALDGDAPSPTLRFRGEAQGDRFGATVALADLDGDGDDEVLVGAPRRNPSGRDEHFASGALYAWYGHAPLTDWNETSPARKADTTIERAQAWLLTGERLATGDLDGDGAMDLVLVHRIQPEF